MNSYLFFIYIYNTRVQTNSIDSIAVSIYNHKLIVVSGIGSMPLFQLNEITFYHWCEWNGHCSNIRIVYYSILPFQ